MASGCRILYATSGRFRLPLMRTTSVLSSVAWWMVASLPRSSLVSGFALQRHNMEVAATPSRFTRAQYSQNSYLSSSSSLLSRRDMSTSSGGDGGGTIDRPPLTHIGKDQMEDILETLEQSSHDDDCEYVVLDVRGQDEIHMTGKLSPKVHTLPLPIIMQYKVFEMDPDDFEEVCKFPKPELDATLVFSCAAGIRSQQAAYFASMGGYSKLVNYMGGANEWFSPY